MTAAPLTLVVDLGSPVPPYEQVRTQVAAHVSAGLLRPGDRLPTVRALAADLGIAVGTVTRAYRQLETGGLVVSRRRTGTVVAEGAPRTATAAGQGAGNDAAAAAGTSRVHAAAAAQVELARTQGWPDEAVLTAVRGALLAPQQPVSR